MTEDYELVRPLGTGGFAKVYVGKSLETGQDVAIKRIEMLKCVPSEAFMLYSAACCSERHMLCCVNHSRVPEGCSFKQKGVL